MPEGCNLEELRSSAWTGQRKYVHGVIASRKLSSYFLLGALFSLVRAPCVGGMYVAIIGAISGQGSASSGLFYLMIYNLGIALPVLILGGIIALGHESRASGSIPTKAQSCHPVDNWNHANCSGSTHLLAVDLVRFLRFLGQGTTELPALFLFLRS